MILLLNVGHFRTVKWEALCARVGLQLESLSVNGCVLTITKSAVYSILPMHILMSDPNCDDMCRDALCLDLDCIPVSESYKSTTIALSHHK